MFQTTIANESSAEGVGLHTGVYGHVRLIPAPADTGIVFRRVDLDNFPIEAQGHNVARVSYATSLMKQGVLLSTTEHLLAAIYWRARELSVSSVTLSPSKPWALFVVARLRTPSFSPTMVS